jgi:hypothetical protein
MEESCYEGGEDMGRAPQRRALLAKRREASPLESGSARHNVRETKRKQSENEAGHLVENKEVGEITKRKRSPDTAIHPLENKG